MDDSCDKPYPNQREWEETLRNQQWEALGNKGFEELWRFLAI